MKNQALLILKDKSKKLKCCLLQFLFGTVRVNFILIDGLDVLKNLYIYCLSLTYKENTVKASYCNYARPA